MKRVLLVAALGLAQGSLLAADSHGTPSPEEASFQHKSQLVFNLGLQSGGEELTGTVDVASGQQVDTLRAGGYYMTQLGVNLALGDSAFSVQPSLGYLLADGDSNVDERKDLFRRKTAEALVFWNYSRYRFGLGPTLHMDPQLHINFDQKNGQDSNSEDVTFKAKNAIGLVLEADARYDQNIYVGFRFTYITYDFKPTTVTYRGQTGDLDFGKVNGNSYGFVFGYAF